MGMMGTFSYLATEGTHNGLGLNFDILETNLINLSILIGFLLVYGRKFISNILTERRLAIEEEINEAETQAKKAAAELAEAQQKLAQAQAEAVKIRADAETRAQAIKAEILAQAGTEIERMKATAVQELDTEQAKVITELKQRIVLKALEKAETRLKDRLDVSAGEKLIDRCIAQLGGS
jgi:F-type H+-transporting ATPase subunit b